MIATPDRRILRGGQPSASWIENSFRLISLKEILMPRPLDAEGYPMDEVHFGRFFNLLYFIGILEQKALTQKNLIGIEVMSDLAAQDMERWGFFTTAHATRNLVEMLKGESVIDNWEVQITIIRQSLMTELEARVFVPIAPDHARYYREPTKDWEEVIERFPDAVSDIEEAGKCYALGRYAASVFHGIQVVEHGLLSLGEFMQIADPKSGFTAVANELRRVTTKRHSDRSDFEKKHFAFFEQMYGSVEALKTAWRNKVYHAQGKSTVMTADFSPAVAIEIYMATRGFMRRLATDLPKKRGLLG